MCKGARKCLLLRVCVYVCVSAYVCEGLSVHWRGAACESAHEWLLWWLFVRVCICV